MRTTGVSAKGIRLPIITAGDRLEDIVVDSLLKSAEAEGFSFHDRDIVGITEAIAAKAQGNFASVDDVAADIRAKFPGGVVGVVFPILSRNRFLNILKGISKGADKVYLLLNYPQDEVGNPIFDLNTQDEYEDALNEKGFMSEAEFRAIVGGFSHPFTGKDYAEVYRGAGSNIEVYFSRDARDILRLTDCVLDAEIHMRERTKRKLLKAGAKTVYLLSDVLSAPVGGSGYNEKYGVLGSNISTDEMLKLFPRDCGRLVAGVQAKLFEKTGKRIEVLVYGDGAFKDPVCGIWELADPVVSPAFTDGLIGTPNEIKLKFIADNNFGALSGEEKRQAVTDFIKAKGQRNGEWSEGTTPRRYHDLIGSLCDLMSGSGDKGTPVILIQGYFDDYSTQ